MKKALALITASALLTACSSALAAPGADAIQIIGAQDPAALKVPEVTGPEIWKDPSQPVDARVRDLISRMSLAEKASQLSADAPALPRLGIPAYSYRNECLHGKARSGIATVFPQVIGMAATWDPPLIHQEADVIATEARAVFNDYTRTHGGNSIIQHGLSFYAPNINIFRDPRWGRGQETYGEDPFLTAQFAIAYITGLQGDNPKYIKAMACAKHFAVHSGPDPLRTYFNAKPPERDLYDTYLPAFEAAVRQAHVGSVMGSYNELYGVPNCENPFLLTQVLRQQWGFQGFVVSDGGAILKNWQHHKYEATAEEACANALKAGCDLFSGQVAGSERSETGRRARRRKGSSDAVADGQNSNSSRRSRRRTASPGAGSSGRGANFKALGLMLQQGLISEAQIDTAISYTLAARFRLGLFDPPQDVPWSNITMADNDTPAHRALALKVAEESIVLLKNDGALPLDRAKIKRIAVIGPNANVVDMLYGNYSGIASHPVTILDGIKAVAGPGIQVTYTQGCPLALSADPGEQATNGEPTPPRALEAFRDTDEPNEPPAEMKAQALAAAQAADVIIFVSGINGSSMEREGGGTAPYQGFLGGDRTRIELPPPQENLLKALSATGKPVVLVNCSGSAMAMPWEAARLPAIVQAWYPGEEGGRAVAKVLFGDVNPAGRLPVTFYRSTADLPDFEDYSMSNRTYRYFNGKPLFAFGYGLSYTKFEYSDAKLDARRITPDGTIHVSFAVKNIGARDGDEVAQVYFRHVHSVVPQPRMALCGFTRIHVAAGDTANVTMDIPAERLRYWDTTTKQYVVEPGKYQLLIGAASDDVRLKLPFKVANDF